MQKTVGAKPNTVAQALGERSEMRSILEAAFAGADWAVVTKYDFAKQRVDVVLKGDPTQRFIGVPIFPAWGNPAVITPIVSEENSVVTKPESKATMGILLYPRLDSGGQAQSRQAKKAPSSVRFAGLGCWFIPGEPKLDSDTLPNFLDAAATVSDLDKVGPKDHARIFKRSDGKYNYLIEKEDGTVVWKVKKLILVDDDEAPADAKEIARKGDAITGTCPTGAVSGTVNAGHTNFRAGV